MGLFPNDPTKSWHSIPQYNHPFYANIISNMRPSGLEVPDAFFMLLEIGFGGCGCFTISDGSNFAHSVVGAAIGFK